MDSLANLYWHKRIFGLNAIPLNSNAVPLKCSSMSGRKCKTRPGIMNINTNKSLFYSYSYFILILLKKCSDSCNCINNPYAKLCVHDTVRDMKIKVFNLISRINEIRHLSWHETCPCKCRLDV